VRHQLIQEIEKEYEMNRPEIKIGDSVRISLRIIEGEKERTQVYSGTVIAQKGHGLSKTISVYRNAYGCSMERVFPLNSPRISKIEVMRSGKVRRSKLYYIRGVSGKAAKVEEKLEKKVEENNTQQTEKKNLEPVGVS